MSHPTRIARTVLASLLVGIASVVAFAAPAGAFPILQGYLKVTPSAGRAGSMVLLQGSKFFPNQDVSVAFWDKNGGVTVGGATTDEMGHLVLWVCVPWNGLPGADKLVADSTDKRVEASAPFIIETPQTASHSPRVTRRTLQTATHVPRDIGGLQRKATDYPQPTSGGGGAWSPDQICV
jgi:hypothetical protein